MKMTAWTVNRLNTLHSELAKLQKATTPGDAECAMVWNERERTGLVSVMNAIKDAANLAHENLAGKPKLIISKE